MAPLRTGTNATSMAAEDCVTIGNGTGAVTNSTCPLGGVYDHEGAMKFVVTTILVYALLGTVTLLFMRIRRRANNMQKVMDTHDEHVQHYLREGGRLKAEGHRMKLRSEIRKFYATVPEQQQHETHYQKKPWLRDLAMKPKSSKPRHDSLTLHVQPPQPILRAHSQPCPSPQPLLRNSSDVFLCEEHELQPLCDRAELDSPVMNDLHVLPPAPSGALLNQSLSESDHRRAENNSASRIACGSNNKDRRPVQPPYSDLQVHQSAKRQKSLDSGHTNSTKHIRFSDSSPGNDSHDTPAGETGNNSAEVKSNSVHPNALQSTEARRESLVSFDGQDVRITSLSLDDVSVGLGGDEGLGTNVVFSTSASMEPKLYSETGM